MDERFDTETFLAEESRAWADLKTRFAGLTEQQLSEPATIGEWSVRDLLVHVACWHRWMADRLNSYASGFGKLEPFSDGEVDRMNAEFIARFASWPASAVLELSRDAHTRAVVAIRGSAFRGFEGEWQRVIRANTTEHYAEHLPELDAFRAGLS